MEGKKRDGGVEEGAAAVLSIFYVLIASNQTKRNIHVIVVGNS